MEFLVPFLLVAAIVLFFQLLKRADDLASQLREVRAELQRYPEIAGRPAPPRY